MTNPAADPRAEHRAALRRAVLHLVLGVVALDAVAMAAYYLADISHTARRTQTIFAVGWTVATALVVAFLLKRVRQIRFGQTPRSSR
jgi:hypothetical protein